MAFVFLAMAILQLAALCDGPPSLFGEVVLSIGSAAGLRLAWMVW